MSYDAPSTSAFHRRTLYFPITNKSHNQFSQLVEQQPVWESKHKADVLSDRIDPLQTVPVWVGV